jgi:hypothetical protein
MRSLFHAARQPAPQKRSCSRRGAYTVPHSSQVQVSLTASCYAWNLHGGSSQAAALDPPGQAGTLPEPRMVEVTLHVHGKNSVNELAAALSEQQDVDAVLATDVNATDG